MTPMKTWLVSYADASFQFAQQTLVSSALRHGIDECRPWNRDGLVRTPFYRAHRATLDAARGGGYWLWKPYIIAAALKEAAADDLVVYADAGLDIVGHLRPLFAICRERAPIMVFAGHYDDAGAPGPNICGKWTKRDAFVLMDCDEPRYHEGQMLDASFVVVRNTAAAAAFVREWMLYCAQPPILNDEANVCGLPNLPEFIAHRHDQAILSLLAIREGLEIFRHPSQRGNHLKMTPYREAGEWTQHPYGAKGLFENSPYGTLLNHHRGALGQRDLEVVLTRRIVARRDEVFAAWNNPDVLRKWRSTEHEVVDVGVDVRVDGGLRFEFLNRLDGARRTVMGTFLEVQPPSRLVYSWPWRTQVAVDFAERGRHTTIVLRHQPFPTERLREYHVRAWAAFLDAVAAEVSRDV